MRQFDIGNATVVVTSTEILEEKKPILYVSHEFDSETGDIVWQFHSGAGSYDMNNMRLVRLDTILSLDPTVSEIADLPMGAVAIRQFVNSSWEITGEK